MTKINNSKRLLEINRKQLSIIIIISNTVGTHMVRLGIIENDTCGWYAIPFGDSYYKLDRSFLN